MSDPHFEYIVMRLLIRNRSGFSSEVRIRAYVHFPSLKSDAEMATRRKPNHCDEEEENSEAEVRRNGEMMKRDEVEESVRSVKGERFGFEGCLHGKLKV